MKVPILRLSALVKICQILHVIFQTTSYFFFKFCITFQYHEIQLLCTFLAQTLYTLVESSPLKSKFLRLSSARVKVGQIAYVNFEQTSQFFFRFFTVFSVITHNSSVNVYSFKCFDKNLPNSSCHFPNHKPVFVQILHQSSVSLKTTPLYLFWSNVICFAQKGQITVQILET